MMGIPYEGPAYISGDNQFVLANKTIPDSTLKNKSQIIAYHLSVREPHEMSGGHDMSIIMTIRQIYSPSYFTPVKSKKVFSKIVYTISFRQT